MPWCMCACGGSNTRSSPPGAQHASAPPFNANPTHRVSLSPPSASRRMYSVGFISNISSSSGRTLRLGTMMLSQICCSAPSAANRSAQRKHARRGGAGRHAHTHGNDQQHLGTGRSSAPRIGGARRLCRLGDTGRGLSWFLAARRRHKNTRTVRPAAACVVSRAPPGGTAAAQTVAGDLLA